MALGRRIAVLRNGRFEQVGAPGHGLRRARQPRDRPPVRRSRPSTCSPAGPQAGGGASCSASALPLQGGMAALAGRDVVGGHPGRGHRGRAGARARRGPGRARRRDAAQRARRALSAQPRRQGAAGDRGRGRRAALRPRPPPGLGAARRRSGSWPSTPRAAPGSRRRRPEETAMASLVLDQVSKIYRSARQGAGARRSTGSTSPSSDGEIVALLGSSGCGKTSTPAHDRRLRGRDLGRDPRRRPGRSRACRPRIAASPWRSRATRSTRR